MARRNSAKTAQRKTVARSKTSSASAARKKKTKPKRKELPKSAIDNCDDKRTDVGFGKGNNSQLQLSACCKIIRDVFDRGYAKSHPVSRRELKRFMGYLKQEAKEGRLLDYCYIQFDLKEDELAKVQAAVRVALT